MCVTVVTVTGACGAMDNASAYGAEDSRFESWHAQSSLLGGGSVAEWVRASTGDRTFDGSSPTSVKTFLFGTLAIPFTPPASVFRMRQ